MNEKITQADERLSEIEHNFEKGKNKLYNYIYLLFRDEYECK
jgi:hypothetical protein